MEEKKIIKNPLDDYQLLQEASGGSYFFANVDTVGVEQTTVLEGTAKPYIVNEETGEPGVVTGEPLNSMPKGDLDKKTYDNTSDVYFYPEYTYEEKTEEESTDDDNDDDENDDNNVNNG